MHHPRIPAIATRSWSDSLCFPRHSGSEAFWLATRPAVVHYYCGRSVTAHPGVVCPRATLHFPLPTFPFPAADALPTHICTNHRNMRRDMTSHDFEWPTFRSSRTQLGTPLRCCAYISAAFPVRVTYTSRSGIYDAADFLSPIDPLVLFLLLRLVLLLLFPTSHWLYLF